MSDRTNSGANGFALIAAIGLAGYAAYRAADAERKVADPSAKDLSEHIRDTAKADIEALRDTVTSQVDRISRKFDTISDAVREKLIETRSMIEGALAEFEKSAKEAADTAKDAVNDGVKSDK